MYICFVDSHWLLSVLVQLSGYSDANSRPTDQQLNHHCAFVAVVFFFIIPIGPIDAHCWSNMTSQLIIQCCRE